MSFGAKIETEPRYEDFRWLNFKILQGSEPFQPQDHIAFYPGTSELASIENVLLAGLVIKLSKTKEGLKMLERIIIKYLESCAKIVASVEDACHSNWLTALNNQHIALAISHKMGLVDNASYVKIMTHYRSVFDKMFILQTAGKGIEGLHTLVQGAKVASEAGFGLSSLKGLSSIISPLKTT